MKAARTMLGVLMLFGFAHLAGTMSLRPPASAQGQEAKARTDAAYHEKIRAHAEDMHRMIMSGDLDGFITYMHPTVVAQMGGTAGVKELIQPGLAEMRNQIEKMTLGTISHVVAETEGLAAFVSVEMIMRIQGTRILLRSYYVAFSKDEGVSWTFLSSQGKPEQDEFVKQLFPKLTSEIAIPKCEMRGVK